MTLLELTVVILVLLSLIGLLMIGARSWKHGADRSACIINIRNAQNAVRAFQNTRNLDEGTTIDMFVDVIGPGKFLDADPTCPGGGDYEHIGHIPFQGELALVCDLVGSSDHEPDDFSAW